MSTQMTQMERLVIELLGLPRDSRALLAQQLLASLEDAAEPDAEVIDRWAEVAKRRADDLVSGRVEGLPAEEVFHALDEEFRRRPIMHLHREPEYWQHRV